MICRTGGEDTGLTGVVDVRPHRVGGKERIKGGGTTKTLIVVKTSEAIEGSNHISQREITNLGSIDCRKIENVGVTIVKSIPILKIVKII